MLLTLALWNASTAAVHGRGDQLLVRSETNGSFQSHQTHNGEWRLYLMFCVCLCLMKKILLISPETGVNELGHAMLWIYGI